jgi:hypothetical protein
MILIKRIMKPPSRYHMQLFKIQSEKFENFNMK